MRRWDVCDWIFWICEGLLGLWILARLLGWIQTPLIIEMFPLLTLFFMGGSFYQQVVMRLRRLEDDFTKLDERVIFLKTGKKD